MSDFGEGIIERLNENSPLRNTDNPMNIIINNTIGAFLDEYNSNPLFEQVFLNEAEEGYLDILGETDGVYRKIGEDDNTYRNRIIYESIGHLTSNYLNDIFGLDLYVDVYGFANTTNNYPLDFNNTKLTSDNPYINNSNGYFLIVSSIADNRYTTINEKAVLGGKIKWVIL